jgi:hypothetical protein
VKKPAELTLLPLTGLIFGPRRAVMQAQNQ